MTKVLIADDHRIIVRGLEAILRGTDFHIAGTVEDGAAVPEALRALSPDILILDVRMPKRSGIEALRDLRAEGNRIPVALLTAEIEDAALVEAVRLGVDGVVLKDGAHKDLLPCLEALREGRRWIAQDLLERANEADCGEGDAEDPLQGLNARERAIASLVAQGMRNRELAAQLDMNEGTVKVYLYRIYKKLGLGSRTELAIRMRDKGAA